jgi:hypothetical protein
VVATVLDYSPTVHPGGVEIDANGIDDDCDGTKGGEVQTGPPGVKNCPAVCLGGTVEAALCSMDMCYPDLVSGSKWQSPTGSTTSNAWQAIAHYGNANNALNPYSGPSYLLMGTGKWTDKVHEDQPGLGGGSASDPFSKDSLDIYDAVEFSIDLVAPAGATGFSMDYIFMSAEYEEWIGSQFNDKFYIVLTASTTTGGKKTVINSTDCSNPNQYSDGTDPATGQEVLLHRHQHGVLRELLQREDQHQGDRPRVRPHRRQLDGLADHDVAHHGRRDHEPDLPHPRHLGQRLRLHGVARQLPVDRRRSGVGRDGLTQLIGSRGARREDGQTVTVASSYAPMQ